MKETRISAISNALASTDRALSALTDAACRHAAARASSVAAAEDVDCALRVLCGAGSALPGGACTLTQALVKAKFHLDLLSADRRPDPGYHARFALSNLQAARSLAWEELHRRPLSSRV